MVGLVFDTTAEEETGSHRSVFSSFNKLGFFSADLAGPEVVEASDRAGRAFDIEEVALFILDSAALLNAAIPAGETEGSLALLKDADAAGAGLQG